MTHDDHGVAAMRAYDRVRDTAWLLAWRMLEDEERCCDVITAVFRQHAAAARDWTDDTALLVAVHRAAAARARDLRPGEDDSMSPAAREVAHLVFLAKLNVEAVAETTRQARDDVMVLLREAARGLAPGAAPPPVVIAQAEAKPRR